jgi:hypothetical protein
LIKSHLTIQHNLTILAVLISVADAKGQKVDFKDSFTNTRKSLLWWSCILLGMNILNPKISGASLSLFEIDGKSIFPLKVFIAFAVLYHAWHHFDLWRITTRDWRVSGGASADNLSSGIATFSQALNLYQQNLLSLPSAIEETVEKFKTTIEDYKPDNIAQSFDQKLGMSFRTGIITPPHPMLLVNIKDQVKAYIADPNQENLQQTLVTSLYGIVEPKVEMSYIRALDNLRSSLGGFAEQKTQLDQISLNLKAAESQGKNVIDSAKALLSDVSRGRSVLGILLPSTLYSPWPRLLRYCFNV